MSPPERRLLRPGIEDVPAYATSALTAAVRLDRNESPEEMAPELRQSVLAVLAAARDRSYTLAREVEKSQDTLNLVAQDPASDSAVCKRAAHALESLCENLVRLCALTDQASANEIRSSLVYERLMAGDVRRRVSADPVDRLAPVRRP